MTITLGRQDVTGHTTGAPYGVAVAGFPLVLVVDDVPLFARSLSFALRLLGLAEPLREDDTVTSADLNERIRTDGIGVVVVDLADRHTRLPLIRSARDAGARVLAIAPARVLAFEAETLAAGAEAVLDKAQPFDELADDLFSRIVRRVAHQPAGTSGAGDATVDRTSRASRALEALGSLSPREAEVLRWLMRGHTVDRIAADAGLSIATVRSHVRAIHSKLEVSCQLAAVALAYGAGWSVDD